MRGDRVPSRCARRRNRAERVMVTRAPDARRAPRHRACARRRCRSRSTSGVRQLSLSRPTISPMTRAAVGRARPRVEVETHIEPLQYALSRRAMRRRRIAAIRAALTEIAANVASVGQVHDAACARPDAKWSISLRRRCGADRADCMTGGRATRAAPEVLDHKRVIVTPAADRPSGPLLSLVQLASHSPQRESTLRDPQSSIG